MKNYEWMGQIDKCDFLTYISNNIVDNGSVSCVLTALDGEVRRCIRGNGSSCRKCLEEWMHKEHKPNKKLWRY